MKADGHVTNIAHARANDLAPKFQRKENGTRGFFKSLSNMKLWPNVATFNGIQASKR